MIKKGETFLVEDPSGKKHRFRDVLKFKPLFCQPAPTNPTKLAEKVYLGVLQHTTNFQAKILTDKFYC